MSSSGNTSPATQASLASTRAEEAARAAKVAEQAAGIANSKAQEIAALAKQLTYYTTTTQTNADNSKLSAVAAQQALTDITKLLANLGGGQEALVVKSDLGSSAFMNVGSVYRTVAAGDDPRFSDARTPLAHANTHYPGGSDEILLKTVNGASLFGAGNIAISPAVNGAIGLLQYNDSGSLAGAYLSWDKFTNTLSDPNGAWGATAGAGLWLGLPGRLGFGGNNAGPYLQYDGQTGAIGQRDGTNAQGSRVYGSYTDASNWERGVLDWLTAAGKLTIGAQASGTGTVRAVNFVGSGFTFNAPVALANGTSSSPALQFSGNANSGVWADANALRLSWTGVNTIAYNGDWIMANTSAIAWNITNGGDLFLHRDAANSLGLRNGTAAQTLNVYNTFPDATNWERGTFDWQTTPNLLTIGAKAGGTGALRGVNFVGATHTFSTSGGTQLLINDAASAVNYVSVNGNAASSAPNIGVAGNDTNISLTYSTKGTTGRHLFRTNSTTSQFQIAHTASAVNFLSVTGTPTGSGPSLTATGSDTNIDLQLITTGSGAVRLTATGGLVLGNSVPIWLGATAVIDFSGRGQYTFAGSSIANIKGANGTSVLSRLQFGSTGTNAPALAIVGTTLKVQLADLSADAPLTSGAFTSSGAVTSVGSANSLAMAGSAAGATPTLTASGSDTNISLSFAPKGAGSSNFVGTLSADTVSVGANNLGVNILTNGSFNTDLSGWTVGTGVTWSSGVASIPASSGALEQAIPTVAGRIYTVTATSSGNSFCGAWASPGQNAVLFTPAGVSTGTTRSGTFSFQFVATGATSYVVFGGNASTTITIDNVTVVLAADAYMARDAASGALNLYAGGALQVSIPASGSTVNYWRLEGAAASVSPGLSLAGSDANISGNLTSKGTGSLSFMTNGYQQRQFSVTHTANAVNYLSATGAVTTSAPILTTTGADADVPLWLVTKGQGGMSFRPGNAKVFEVLYTAGGVNYLSLTGGATGAAPTLTAAGSDTNVSLSLAPKGTGSTNAIGTLSTDIFNVGASSLGTNLVTNGAFNTDASGWSTFNSSVSAVNGQLVITVTALGTPYAYTSFPTVVGRTYKWSLDYIRGTTPNNNQIRIGSLGASGTDYVNQQIITSASGVSGTFVATGTTAYITLGYGETAVGQTSLWDNISVMAVADAIITRDAANTIAQRNGVNAQSLRVYNTYTDASNYERGVFDWSTNSGVLTIGAQAAGTGTKRNVEFVGGTITMKGDFYVSSVGASGAVHLDPAGWVDIWGRGRLSGTATNVLSLGGSNATTTLAQLQFGAADASAPSLVISGTALKVQLADKSADAPLTSGDFTSSGKVTSSAANSVSMAGGAAGTPVTLTASGSDANIDINLITKGTGVLKVNGVAVGSGGGGGVSGPAGSDTQVQFNDGGALAGSASLTFNKLTSTLASGNLALTSGTVAASGPFFTATQTWNDGGVGDPYYNSVSLLLHGDGANASTTFTDSSSNALALTASGGAQISTTQSKFGGSAMSFNGSGSYLTTAAAVTNFAFPGDYTVDFWAWKSANGSVGFDAPICTYSGSSGATGWWIELSATRGFIIAGFNGAGGTTIYAQYNPGGGFPNDSAWHHYAAQRSGTTVTLFRDGVPVATGTSSVSMPAAQLLIGKDGSNEYFNGYLDDLRVTKGVARYSASGFSVPTIAVPNTTGNSTVVFTGIKTNITDLSSGNSSLLVDLQKNSVSQFSVDKNGNMAALGGLTLGGGGSNATNTPFFTATQTWNDANGDPFFNSVAYLLHMDGTNGSTAFTDSSGYGRTLSVFGAAALSSVQSKFGGTAGAFNLGATPGDYLQTQTGSPGLGAGDWTVECWFYPTKNPNAYQILIDTRNAGATGQGLLMWVDNSGNLRGWAETISSGTPSNGDSYIAGVTLNTWHHGAVVCKNGVITTYLDGAAAPVTKTRNANSLTSTWFTVGQTHEGGNYFFGYIDEVRVTIGGARYTTAFTPPNAAFSQAQTFTGLKVNVTDTSSYATLPGGSPLTGSLLADFEVGGVSKAVINKSGRMAATATAANEPAFTVLSAGTMVGGVGTSSTGVSLYNSSSSQFFAVTGTGGFSLGDNVYMYAPVSSILEQRNGALAQGSRVYNTWTDASNWERGVMDWSIAVGTLTIGAQAGGTGQLRPVAFIGQSFSFANGPVVAPSLQQAATTAASTWALFNTGLGFSGANRGVFWTNGTTADPSTAATDLSIQRNSAGVLEINNGTAGQFRDLTARALTLTNPYSANVSAPFLTLSQTWDDWQSDPYFSSVSMLLHFDGTSGTATFTDSSSLAAAPTVNGSAVLSSTQSKFGGTAGFFNGTTQSLLYTANAAYSPGTSGDFTVECWVYSTLNTGNRHIVQLYGADIGNRIALYLASGVLSFFTATTAGGGAVRITALAALPLNAWHHIALVRSGSTWMLFQDGVLQGTSATTVVPTATNLGVSIGTQNFTPAATDWFAGYLDDVRLTKGVARYTSNFTLPTVAFANASGVSSTVFTGIKANITDLSSSSTSVLMDLQKNSVSRFSVDKTGSVAMLGALRAYNVFTDASNYERGVFDWTSAVNTLTIGAQAAGTGTQRIVNLVGSQLQFNGVAVPLAIDIQHASNLVGNGGTGSTSIAVGFNPPITSLAHGMELYVRASTANTTTTPTFAPDSIGAKTITKGNGLPLAIGDIAGNGHWLHLQYNADLNTWSLLNPATGVTSGGGVAGSDTQVQFNDGGALAGSAAFTFSKLTSTVGINGQLTLAGGTVTTPAAPLSLTQTWSDPTVGDLYFSNVTLLLHADGADGATSTVDSSSLARTVTTVASAKLSATQKKFGTTSMAFTGTLDSAFTVSDTGGDYSFGTGDFTIEYWVYHTSFATAPYSMSHNSVTTGQGFYIYNNTAGALFWGWGGATSGSSSYTALSINTWYHIAFSRVAGVLRCFINGVQAGSDLAHTVNYSTSSRGILSIGRDNSSGNDVNGYVDEVRITKGVGRYASTFTVPAAAFPSAGNASANFTALQVNVTDTNSGTNSALLDLQKGSTSQFKVDKNGNVTALGSITTSSTLSAGAITSSGALTAASLTTAGGITGTALTLPGTFQLLNTNNSATSAKFFSTNVSGTLIINDWTNTKSVLTLGDSGNLSMLYTAALSFGAANNNSLNLDLGFTGTGTSTTPAINFHCGGSATVYTDVMLRVTNGTNTNFGGTFNISALKTALTGALTSYGATLTALVNVNAPVLTPSTTGGSLAAGTYYITIVAVDAQGQCTAPINQASVTTTGSTSSILINWSAVTGMVSYRVYCGTSSFGQTSYFSALGATYTLTTLSGATAGALPSSNQTGSLWLGGSNANIGLQPYTNNDMTVGSLGNIVARFTIANSLGNNNGLILSSTNVLSWASAGNATNTPDTGLWRDAAGVIAQRNGANAQGNRVYNTYTDASNYERAVFDWTTSANYLTIGAQAAGTGAVRALNFVGSGFQFGISNNISTGLEIGYTGGSATTPYIDFHSGASVVDYDARIIASGGNGAMGGGTLTFNAAAGVFQGTVSATDLSLSNSFGLNAGGGTASAIPAATFYNATSGNSYGLAIIPKAVAGGWNPLVQANDTFLMIEGGAAETGAMFLGVWSGNQTGVRISNANVNLTASSGIALTSSAITLTGTTAIGSASANYWQLQGGGTGFGVGMLAVGSDANIEMAYTAKGNAGHAFSTGSTYMPQFKVLHTDNAVNYAYVIGGSAGNGPTLSNLGSDANINFNYLASGTGSHVFKSGSGGSALFVYNSFTDASNWERAGVDWQTTAGTLTLGAQAAGTGTLRNVNLVGGATISIKPSNVKALDVTAGSSAVNYLLLSAGNAFAAPIFTAQGSDTNIGISFATKGTGKLNFTGNGGTVATFSGVGGNGNYLAFSNATSGNAPTISVNTSSDANADLILAPVGTGVVKVNTDTVVTANATQTLANKTLTNALLQTAREKTTPTATAATGTVNYDALTQSVLYYTAASTANFTINLRGNSSSTLNSIMNIGDSLTVVFLNTNGVTAHYANAFQIDGVAVTPKWQGGTAPSAGHASSIDSFSYMVIKTADATYTVLASLTQYA